MAKLKLSCALSPTVLSQPVIDGTVAAEAIDLEITPLHPSEMFFRQLKYAEFDVSEMSCSSLTIATSQAQTQWVAIPVFTTRRFFHTRVMVRTDRGIEQPADLNGKRVGIPEFQQTAAIWTRSVLRSEYGVDATTQHWHMERNPDQSHGGQTGFGPPPGIDLQYVPKDKNLGQMLIDGELDALEGWIDARNLVDRSSVDPRTSPNVRYLFDPATESKRYYEKTKIYPINHCLVVRRSIVKKYPWVVLNLYSMFEAAKASATGHLDAILAPYLESGLVGSDIVPKVHTDLMPYGVKRSRHVLETITRSVYEDGLAQRIVGLDEIFSPNTLEL